ncbi:MAG: hypothetical protein ABI576_20535 [Flavobacterium sp.]
MDNITKNIALILTLIILMVSCKEKKESSFDTEKESISSVLTKFPMINKNLTLVKKIDLDSLSITLLRNNNDNKVYDEVLVFEKKNKFYTIPFFSNMYVDFWDFKNDTKLFPKTNSTFDKEFSKLITVLNITPSEFDLIINELMVSVLHAEDIIETKSNSLKNNVYWTHRVDKYKIEESDDCIKRTNKIFDQISKESNVPLRRFQYFLDKKNGRIYKIENKAKNHNELKINTQVYRIDCYSYSLNI